ncbi:MAG: precorrin-6Y C5,15-methyltransferase (decarboxylating) subunit CbiT [Nitrososphaeraceae archaeon]
MIWNYNTPGIPDELFVRSDKVPITKEEIRSLIISKLRLKKGNSAIDIGCGSGSVTVELCLQSNGGKIYGIDFDYNAIKLTKENLKRFNAIAEIFHGKAQDLLPNLPKVSAIVVGGTDGNTEIIIEKAIERLEKNGRIVISNILIETMFKAIKTIETTNLIEVDLTQISILKSRKVSTGTMMTARNPVLLISATKPY